MIPASVDRFVEDFARAQWNRVSFTDWAELSQDTRDRYTASVRTDAVTFLALAEPHITAEVEAQMRANGWTAPEGWRP